MISRGTPPDRSVDQTHHKHDLESLGSPKDVIPGPAKLDRPSHSMKIKGVPLRRAVHLEDDRNRQTTLGVREISAGQVATAGAI